MLQKATPLGLDGIGGYRNGSRHHGWIESGHFKAQSANVAAAGATLERTLRTATAGTAFRVEKMETGLEDVFIYMMKQSADDSGANA